MNDQLCEKLRCRWADYLFVVLYKSTNRNQLLLTIITPSPIVKFQTGHITAFLTLRMWRSAFFGTDCDYNSDAKRTRRDSTFRVGTLFYFSYTVPELWSYSIVLCSQTIGMTKTPHSPIIIHSSNHSVERSLYLAREAVCAMESMLSYFLSSLVFQMVEINCMACWWAPEMPFLFWFKVNRQLSLWLQRTHCSISQIIVKIS